ncbi:MAG: cache domain-containing protein [Agarilytica sp.]
MTWFSSLSVGQRLTFNIIFALLCLFITMVFNLFDKRQNMMDARQHELKVILESTHNVIDSIYAQFQNGQLNEEEAKQKAIAVVDKMRFDESGYINIVNLNGTMVNHAIKKDLNGRDVSQLQDPKGAHIISEALEIARTQGNGFHEYYWPKPNSEKAEKKIAGIWLFKPWGWALSVGVYVDDIQSSFSAGALRSVLIIGGIATILLVISSLTSKSIISPIKTMTVQLKEVSETQNLTIHMKESGAKEVQTLAREFNTLMQSMRDSLRNVQLSTTELSNQSQMLSEASNQIASSSNQQKDATNSIAATVEEFTATVDDLAQNASHMRELSNTSSEQSKLGSQAMSDTVKQIQDIAVNVRGSSSVIGELGTLSGNIQEIVNVIQSVAEQTNLLALNAAIEAARAGEQGRGFAVVADEVRQLAARTAESSGQISGTIGEIQTATQTAMTEMETGVEKVDIGLKHVNDSDAIIHNLQDSSENLEQIIDQVSNALGDQTTASNEMSTRVSDIAHMAETNSRIAEQTQQSIKQLYSLVEKLTDSTAKFTI